MEPIVGHSNRNQVPKHLNLLSQSAKHDSFSGEEKKKDYGEEEYSSPKCDSCDNENLFVFYSVSLVFPFPSPFLFSHFILFFSHCLFSFGRGNPHKSANKRRKTEEGNKEEAFE